jgi:pilus assembly protein Flp/PilA
VFTLVARPARPSRLGRATNQREDDMQLPATYVRLAWAQAIGLAMAVAVPVRHRFDVHGKDRGATAVEYGLLVGLIAIVIIVGVGALGGRLQGIFANLAAQLGG